MTVFFATFLTGIPGIPPVGAFFAAFRAADDRAFRAETGNPEGIPRQTDTFGKMAAPKGNHEDG